MSNKTAGELSPIEFSQTEKAESPVVISRQEAITKGLKRYFTGKPCKHGHTAERKSINSACLMCASILRHKRYVKNSEEAIRGSREWQKKNPEKNREKALKCYHRNRERNLQCKRKYYSKNYKAIMKRNLEWVRANPEKIAIMRHNYRARKRMADGFYKIEDLRILFKKQNAKCANCSTSIKGKYKHPRGMGLAYHVDHKNPLSKGGNNWPFNLQLLCPSCNHRKSAKDPLVWAKENGRLFNA